MSTVMATAPPSRSTVDWMLTRGFSDRPQRTTILNRIWEKHRNCGYMDVDRFVNKKMHLVS